MNADQLPKLAQDELKTLEISILNALNASKTKHTTAVSQSSVPPNANVNDALIGGSINAPSKPFIDYDKHAITQIHWRVHKASEGTLHSIVIHAERTAEGGWKSRTKLVSVAEHDALVQARRPIDANVEAELRRWTNVPNWERVSFGRSSPTLPVKLLRSSRSARDFFEPSAELMAQLAAAEKLYADAGHKLLVADWTLRGGGLDFREYFE